MWFVYLLKSKEYKKSYVGCTDNIERRLAEHNAGRSIYTKRYKPWILIYKWTFDNYRDARKKEKYLKTGNGREELKEIFKTK